MKLDTCTAKGKRATHTFKSQNALKTVLRNRYTYALWVMGNNNTQTHANNSTDRSI